MEFRQRVFGRIVEGGISPRLLAFLAAWLLVFSAQALPPETIYQQTRKQVVSIETFDKWERPIAQGSGVVLRISKQASQAKELRKLSGDPGISSDFLSADILSNFHVIAFARHVLVTTQSGKSARALVVWFDAERDLAVLRIHRFDALDSVKPSKSWKVGQKVYALGAPKGLGWSFSDGMISGERLMDGLNLVQTTAPISPGSSGGGLFSENAEIIGITTLSVQGGQNLNLALPMTRKVIDELTTLIENESGTNLVPYDNWVLGFVAPYIIEYGLFDDSANKPSKKDLDREEKLAPLQRERFQEWSSSERERSQWNQKLFQGDKETTMDIRMKASALRRRLSSFPRDVRSLLQAFRSEHDSVKKAEILNRIPEQTRGSVDVITALGDLLASNKECDKASDLVKGFFNDLPERKYAEEAYLDHDLGLLTGVYAAADFFGDVFFCPRIVDQTPHFIRNLETKQWNKTAAALQKTYLMISKPKK